MSYGDRVGKAASTLKEAYSPPKQSRDPLKDTLKDPLTQDHLAMLATDGQDNVLKHVFSKGRFRALSKSEVKRASALAQGLAASAQSAGRGDAHAALIRLADWLTELAQQEPARGKGLGHKALKLRQKYQAGSNLLMAHRLGGGRGHGRMNKRSGKDYMKYLDKTTEAKDNAKQEAAARYAEWSGSSQVESIHAQLGAAGVSIGSSKIVAEYGLAWFESRIRSKMQVAKDLVV